MSPHTCYPCVRSIQLRQKKVTKEKATPSLRPRRFAPGHTCVVSAAGCAVELALRCARSSVSHGESVHEAWALRRPCHPATAPPQAQPAGVGQPNSQHPFGPLLRSASSRGRKRHALRKLGRAKQRPVWLFCPPCPSGCAEERRVWRMRARDCLSEVKRSEFERDPAKPEHRRLPRSVSAGDADSGVAFLLGTFLWRSKEKYLACRATPGLRP